MLWSARLRNIISVIYIRSSTSGNSGKVVGTRPYMLRYIGLQKPSFTGSKTLNTGSKRGQYLSYIQYSNGYVFFQSTSDWISRMNFFQDWWHTDRMVLRGGVRSDVCGRCCPNHVSGSQMLVRSAMWSRLSHSRLNSEAVPQCAAGRLIWGLNPVFKVLDVHNPISR